MIKKYYELNKGDIAVMEGEEFVFYKIDGMYAHWLDAKGSIRIGHYEEYEQKEDSKWYPVTN